MTAHSNANSTYHYMATSNTTSINLPNMFSVGNGYARSISPGPMMTTGNTFTYTTTFNGDPTDPTLFMTPAQRLEHQQKSYLEPRDHEYNPDQPVEGWLLAMPCQDCYQHNMHRMSADKHLYVIQEDEDIDWLSQLAS